MTELPMNAAAYRYELSRTSDVATRMAELAAERRAAAIEANKTAKLRDKIEQAAPRPSKKKEWWELAGPRKMEAFVEQLFHAGEWGKLLAMHYHMVRLTRKRSASEKVVNLPTDARCKPVDSDQVIKFAAHLTDLLDQAPSGDLDDPDVQGQLLKLVEKVAPHLVAK